MPQDEPESRDTLARTRRAASAALLVALVAVCLLSTFDPDVRVCGDALASTGEDGAVTICRPLSLTDPGVLLAALLALLLLLPDLSSLKIAGLVELERTAEQTRDRVEEVRGQLALLTTVSTAAASSSSEQTVVVAPAAAADSSEGLEQKGRRFLGDGPEREERSS